MFETFIQFYVWLLGLFKLIKYPFTAMKLTCISKGLYNMLRAENITNSVYNFYSTNADEFPDITA